MRRIVLILILFIALKSVVFAQASLSDKIDELAVAYTKQNKFSGAVLVARGGEVIFKKGYGMADYSANIPNTTTTRFRIASMTKQFTAAAILLLEEAGKLSVKDKLSEFIPDYPQGDKITIHHLLTHTSGIFNYTRLPEIDSIMRQPATYEGVIGLFKNRPLEFEPGEKYRYSNSAYILLSYIIEKTSGIKYEDYMREAIFKPLGMKDTGVETGMEIPSGHAFGYAVDSAGTRRVEPYNMFIAGGSGAMYSTVEDLYLWDRALTTEKLLKKATLERMFTPFKDNYGYGWDILSAAKAKSKRTYIQHGGVIPGFSSHITRMPDNDVTVITLANRICKATTIINFDAIKILFNEPYDLPVERIAISIDTRVLKDYIGEYQLPEYSLVISEENGKLFGQAPEESRFELYPESETSFFLKVVDAQVRFLKDDTGNVTELIVHQNGKDITGKKVK